MKYEVDVLGYIKTCFPEKFGIPRQPLLVSSSIAELVLLPPYNQPDAFDGLEKSSHIWLCFIFHEHINQKWTAKVRPPRLGGNKKCGVFASRSSFRPNFLGQSAVKLEQVKIKNNKVTLLLSGIDLVDGTPIVDIKPYIPYSDCISDAVNLIADEVPEICEVRFLEKPSQFCKNYLGQVDITTLIRDVLQQDPRPAFHLVDSERIYKMKLLDVDIHWRCRMEDEKKIIEVVEIEQLKAN